MPVSSRKWTIPFKMRVTFLLLLLCSILETEAIPKFFLGKYGGQTRRDFIFDQMMDIDTTYPDPKPDESVCPDDPNKKVKIDWFEQPLDHFSNDSTAKWQQHYQEQNMFFKEDAESPVIFLHIGGEEPISNKWVCFENYTYMQAAKNYSAKVIQLEHRFFGKNKNMGDLSFDSLKFLTTEQALADINNFILAYNKDNKLTNPKWVAFGGSYPGTMAALLRLVYPTITQGNIASSAPMYPVVDYWQYAYVMENTIKNTSQACYDAVKGAFADLVANTLTRDGRQKLNDKFKIVEPKLDVDNPRKEDVDTVGLAIFDAFQGIIQYTYDARDERSKNGSGERQNIGWACKLMTNPGVPDSIDRLYQIFQLANGKDGKFVANYEKSIEPLKKTTLDESGDAAMRGWMWLSCNEFGWLQSTSNNGLFGDVVPISYFIKMCADLFDTQLTAGYIDGKITETLRRYGYPQNYNATNVFLPNGAFDPWSALGILDDPKNEDRAKQHVVTHLTPEAAHCSDMYASYENEPSGLAATREMFFNELDYYLSLESTFKTGNGALSSMVVPGYLLVFVSVCLYLVQ